MSDTYVKSRTSVSRLGALAAAVFFAFTSITFAQTANEPQAIVANRIVQPVNEAQRVTLAHNVHPLAQAKFDQGAAPGSMATGRIMLVLKRSNSQQFALKQYLGDLQNPNSPNYRKWITPEEYGKRYGISDADLNTVTSWLQSHGFTVNKVPQARNVIEFSGNAAQVQQAFTTSIHRYLVNGETHYANSANPQIPSALAPVVAGIASLNDFFPKSHAIKGPKAHFDAETKRIKADLTLSSNSQAPFFLYVDPADAATIYDTPNKNLNSAYKGSQLWDGTGVTIGIAGDSDFPMSDIQNYRAAFLNDNTTTHLPKVIVDGNDPGVNGDAVEAVLDNEVAGGLAPGANINFYTASDTDLQSGLFLAIFRAIDDNAVSILNVSFGGCELSQGAGGNQLVMEVWEQAAAQGITVTVSTGDEGSAACDNSNTEVQAQGGLAVNGLASTPFNVAVGGTDFDVLSTGTAFTTYLDPTASAPYLDSFSNPGTAPYYGTALGYIPEKPWNDSTSSNNATAANTPTQLSASSGTTTTIAGAGGGLSNAAFCTTDSQGNCINGTFLGYAKPPFQTSMTPNDGVRDLPDVSLLASDGTYGSTWVICADSSVLPASDGSTYTDCQLTNGVLGSGSSFNGVGGTSAAAPAFAGMLALISQSQGGQRLGQVNNVLYNLAAQGSLYNTVFHDITEGNNSVFCAPGSPNCGSNSFLSASSSLGGYDAVTGYDTASGLGSVDVNQLIANWSKAAFTQTSTTLSLSGTRFQHGQTINLNVAVNPGSATGDVSFNTTINPTQYPNNGAIGGVTLTNGTAVATTNALPGGTYNVYAYYGGDVNNAPSQSTSIPVTITAEPSSMNFNVMFYDALSGQAMTAGSSVPYGAASSASATPFGTAEGNNSTTLATGAVTFTDNNNTLPNNPVNIASNGTASYNNFTVQSQSFSVGNHSVGASYAGDPSYSASTATPVSFSVIQGTTMTVAQATQSGTTVTLVAQVNTDSIGLAPTGTVTFKSGSTTLGTVTTSSQTGFVSNPSGQGSTVASLYQLLIPSSQLTSAAKPAKTAQQSQPAFPWGVSGASAVLAAGIFFFAIPARRRNWRNMLGILIFAVTLSVAMGCGSSSGGSSTTTPPTPPTPPVPPGPGTVTAVYSGDTNYTASTSATVTVTTSTAQ